MMLKRSTTESKPSAAARLVRAGLVSLAAVGTVAALATGCLDRPVVPAKPTTSNVFVDQIIQTSVDKIDLLFMVDGSVSMSDKQEILKAAVPVLVNRLVSPICVNADGTPAGGSSMNGVCAKGTAEFSAIGDIHIGIVSSNLGSHGSTICDNQMYPDDKAHLIGSVRTGVTTWNNSGFLAWDATGMDLPVPGESNAKNLNTAFQNMIGSVDQHGCGFEASLESWYRFLIDPEPPVSVVQFNLETVRGVIDTTAMPPKVVRTGLVLDADKHPIIDAATGLPQCVNCDETLRAQRKAFLRPDSLVAIVMLSDENDCSIVDSSVGWFVGSSARMPLATDACTTNPNNLCCRSCAQREDAPPTGCPALKDDPVCKNVPAGQMYATYTKAEDDSINLRCYNQHQRFGFNLLYDTNRYVNGLKNPTVALDSSGVLVPNPLYDSGALGKAPRDPSLVFLAGIVGVPWQDIADDASLTGPGLNYLTAKQLVDMGRWTTLLGDPHPPNNAAPVPPTDPFMQESVKPRSGVNPICAGNKCGVPDAKVSIAPFASTDPKANVINGHEQNIPAGDDLQYACTFPLLAAKTCTVGDSACDCSADKSTAMPVDPAGDLTKVKTANSPLCQAANGTISNVQTSAKAYPGARELQVLKDLGDNAIVASICPKVTVPNGDPDSDPNYGYNPAVGAIIERLKDALKGKCLPRPIETVAVDPNDPSKGTQVACKVIEAQRSGCNCALPGRAEADPKIREAVLGQLKSTGQCGNPGQDPCDPWCQCEILQEQGDNLAACQAGQVPPTPGYCYVDKNPTLLKGCPENQQQLLKFVDDAASGTKTPVQGAVAFIACLGAPVGAAAADAGM